MNEKLEQWSRKRWFIPVLLAVVTGVGAYFRLKDLGTPPLRADTITFWNICQSEYTWSEIFGNWIKLGHTGHFPFPNAFIKGFIDTLQLPLNLFTLRLPSALWGILTVPSVYLLARHFGGKGFALFAALLMALSPYHIQLSQEAYFYPPMILGSCLTLWGVIGVLQGLGKESPLGISLVWGVGVGTFLMIYSIPAGWLMFFLSVMALAGSWAWLVKKKLPVNSVHKKALAVSGLLVVPFLFASWGFGQFSEHLGGGSVHEAAKKALATVEEGIGSLLGRLVANWGWGTTPLRMVFVSIVLVSFICFLVRQSKHRKLLFTIPYFLGGALGLFLIAQQTIGFLFEARYVISGLPIYIVCLALGIKHLNDLPVLNTLGRKGGFITPAFLAGLAAVGLWIGPAYLSTELNGKPTPYIEMQEWFNSNLPKGTPVLVDRWFEPWNEMKVYPSTNVVFMFTVPNEPLDNFQNFQWRETAKQFFANNPEGAYLEIAKTYWSVPEVGPWMWPRQYFANHVRFENTAGLKLRHLGMATRPDFYSHDTNRVVVELFYNTKEDVIAKARKEGRPLVFFYGEGWQYKKLWPQAQDFHDWQMMGPTASIEVHNLTDTLQSAVVRIAGVALNGDKKLFVQAGVEQTFPANQMVAWDIGPFQANPGVTVITLQDPGWSTAQNPFLAGQVQVQSSIDVSREKKKSSPPSEPPASL